jgi:hypothetical protein
LIYDPNVGVGEPDGDPTTGTFSSPGGFPTSLGVSVDGNGDIVQGNSSIRKFDGGTNGLIWATANPVGGGGDTRGVVADSSNNIWAVNRAANNTTKFRGTDGQFLNTVPTGNNPYTYSDATGIGFQLANPNGIYTGIFDGEAAGTEWDEVNWNNEPEASEPPGTSITVTARSADSIPGLELESYAAVTNGAGGLGALGQYLQVRSVLTPDGLGTSPVLSDIGATAIEALIEVAVDIKPGSCRNPLNVKKKGVLPAAILGTADFDVSDVDVSTIELAGVAPLRSDFEDVATPFVPFIGKADAFDCTTDGADGFTDLTLKFDAQAIIAALGPVSHDDVIVVQLTGELLDGTEIIGEDVIVILKK